MSIGGVHSGSMGGRPSGGVWKDTGGEVTIHVRAVLRGPAEGHDDPRPARSILPPPPPARIQSHYKKVSP